MHGRNVTGNPLHCDCGIRWLQRLLASGDARLQDIGQPASPVPTITCLLQEEGAVGRTMDLGQARLEHCGGCSTCSDRRLLLTNAVS